MRFQAENVRLLETVVSAAEAASWVSRPLAPGLARALAWDEGGALRPLTRELARGTGKGEGAFWERAVRARGPIHITRRVTTSRTVIWTLLGGHPWVSALLLDLGEVATQLPQDWYDPVLGVLVGAPTRSSVHIHLLGTSDDPRSALVDLAVLCHAGFHTTPSTPHDPDLAAMLPVPRPLTPAVYWFHDGALEEIPVAVDLEHDRVEVHPPDAFQRAVLDRI